MIDYEDLAPISMTYLELPNHDDFIKRFDIICDDGIYSMELVDDDEIAVGEILESLNITTFVPTHYSHKTGYQLDAEQMWEFLNWIVKSDNDDAWNFASSIMTTLGYEWI